MSLALILPFMWLAQAPGVGVVSSAQQDSLLRWRAVRQPADPRIIIVDIDEASIAAMAPHVGRWPWPRSVHAEVASYLSAQQAAAIVFDVIMSEADIFRPDDDAFFAEVVAANDNIYLPSVVQRNTVGQGPLLSDYPKNLGLLADSGANIDARAQILTPQVVPARIWRTGTINTLADGDGVIRRYPGMFAIGKGWSIASLASVVASDLGAATPATSDIFLDWRSDMEQSYSSLSFASVYRDASNGTDKSSIYGDKIFIVGSTATGLHDIHVTPVSQYHPGVNILATAIDNFLNGDQIQVQSVWAQWLVAASMLMLVNFILDRKKLMLAALVIAGVSLLLWLLSYILIAQGYLINIVPIMFCLLILLSVATAGRYLRHYRQLQTTIQLFERFMDPRVVRELIKDGGTDELLHTRACQITVLFSDIRNFTHLSEQRSAVEVVNLLDEYFSRQVEVIFRHGGTLDKFIGDAVMAFWGAPLSDDNQQSSAVAAGIEMLAEVNKFKREYFGADMDDNEFDIGIGIHTGTAVVGVIGSDRRYDYTAIGDSVNLASRIEGLTKGRSRILVSESTKVGCGGDYDFEHWGVHSVKGRESDVKLYAPIAE